MLNHSCRGNSSLGSCRFTLPWVVALTQTHASFIDALADQFIGELARPRRPRTYPLLLARPVRSESSRHAFLYVCKDAPFPLLP
jgi:hypothetical protein